MAVTPRLEIKQSQSLQMTQQLRQAINLLQISNLELETVIAKELEQNPFLEKEDDFLSGLDSSEQTINDYDEAPTPNNDTEEFAPDIDYENSFDDFGSDCEGYDNSQQYDWQNYSDRKIHQDSEDYNYFEQKLSQEDSLYDLLEKQIYVAFTNHKERLIAQILCEHLDGSGYFRGNINTLADNLKTSVENIKNILQQMKGFEPSGIFAENLAECLQIQLKDRNRLDPMAQKVLENLELLGSGKIKELKKIANADDEDLATIITDIKSLNPKPAANYHLEHNNSIIPDVFVRRHSSGEYLVELNQITLPKVLINREYSSKINHNKQTDKYIRQQLSHASFIVKSLHRRAETILKVSEEIVRNQRDFLEYGIEHLKPLQLKDIAEAAEIHESTVSRAVTAKYIHTPRGLFELKYFFSQAAGKLDGSEDTSTTSIKHKIKELINNEQTNNILSDDKLVEVLATQGIKIARRTVAKYRESMNIPTSAERKRIKRKS